MLTARMTSIGTLRIGEASCVPAPTSFTLDCLAVPSEPPGANVVTTLIQLNDLYAQETAHQETWRLSDSAVDMSRDSKHKRQGRGPRCSPDLGQGTAPSGPRTQRGL